MRLLEIDAPCNIDMIYQGVYMSLCIPLCVAVVVVVWFGDPCESPGALLLKAAPGYVVFTA